MPSFLNHSSPVLTVMLKSKSRMALIADIESALSEGAEAFGFQLDMLKPEEKNQSCYRDVINAMQGKPCYLTNYRRGNSNPSLSDEALAEQLLCALDCGGTLIDVTGNMFDNINEEITYNETAVRRQIEFITEIHKRGGEVLMSSHMFRFLPCEQVLEIAEAHQSRGADISKIVTDANSDAESDANLRTTLELKRSLDIKSLFLCNGSHCAKHRMLGPVLGSCMYLCVGKSEKKQDQPYIQLAKAQLGLINQD